MPIIGPDHFVVLNLWVFAFSLLKNKKTITERGATAYAHPNHNVKTFLGFRLRMCPVFIQPTFLFIPLIKQGFKDGSVISEKQKNTETFNKAPKK